MKSAVLFALFFLLACQAEPVPAEPSAGVTMIPIASVTPGLSGERQSLEGYFSFISPADFEAEFEKDSAFISDSNGEIFISLAIIGAGEDERTVQGLLDDIFGKFDDVDIKNPERTLIDGNAGQKVDFSGVISQGVVSGYYVTTDLGNDISFLAFGMGKVTQDSDSWQQFGELNFMQLLDTVDILFGSSF